MLATLIIGLVIFIISFLLSLLIVLGSICKKVGATNFGIAPVLFFIFFPCFCLALELAIFYPTPNVWGVAYFVIAMNAYFLFIQYFFLIGSAIFTRNCIYRLTKLLLWKKHSYNDVIGYVMKKSSGTTFGRFGERTAVMFDVEIYFNDNQYASFSTKDQNNRKVTYIKQMLEEHHCHRNGRIKKARFHK